MIFQGVGTYNCEKCGWEDYDDYGIVRNYLEAHKGATTSEVSLATGISHKEINDMLREEKFEITTDSRSFLKCISCDAMIRSGRYCPTCAKIAEAAKAKKKREQEVRERHLNITGTTTAQNQDSGAKRFSRDK